MPTDTDNVDSHEYEGADDSPLLNRRNSGTHGVEEPPRRWDAFMEYPASQDDGTGDSKVFEYSAKLLKAVVYVFVFCTVLGTAVVAKGSLLLMTSAIKKQRGFHICRKGLGLGADKSYNVVLSDDERRGWIWCLMFSLVFPEILTFLKCVKICIFKTYKKPKLKTFITVFIAEMLQTFGLVLLVFVVFPNWDAAKATVWSTAVFFIPSFLSVVSKIGRKSLRHGMTAMKCTSLLMSVAAVAFQVLGHVVWKHPGRNPEDEISALWPTLAAISVSFGWWENFVDKGSRPLSCLASVKQDLKKSRFFVYIFVSVIKVTFIVLLACLCLYLNGENVRLLFVEFPESFRSNSVNVHWRPGQLNDIPDRVQPELRKITLDISSSSKLPILVFAIHAVSSFTCYIFATFACKIGIQAFSFSFPLCLAVPAAFCGVSALCGIKQADNCVFNGYSPYLFWKCPEVNFLGNFFLKQNGWVWLLWLISQTLLTLHVWTPRNERLAPTQKLFVNPMYNSVVLDQSLLLNRRRNDRELHDEQFFDAPRNASHLAGPGYLEAESSSVPKTVPRIYACATMWHETTEEMEQLLKSIMRMDEDQSARKNAQIYLQVPDPDYYLLEFHILFDDAFVVSDENEDESVVNRFVKDLIGVIDSAASKVHEVPMELKPPIRIPTPYGGRLVWTLPGGNHLYVHLKNKELIRHKKRWSQVMYMYYLLGHRLMELDLPVEEKSLMAENTYILALDGDIDFRPKAVRLLVDLMNRNKILGAACGRIHPIGSGAMVYYQKFEYAIGHWLQKATEHMIGCVLCSPGCFSLFRAKALMDDNVMKTYTKKAKEATDYIQCDQGEDRWLCTLLLQRGYRVEYSAASDAYTHCPETFAEFYSQRRRWAPSTMANILDLLIHYKTTVSSNDSISMLYIAYQALLMMGTILGPGTIFLMLVGAMVSALGISNLQSFIGNFIPIGIFIVVCFLAKNDTQIFVAQILSAGYALLMMAVLVGISLQLVEDGITSPSAIFLLSLAASFLVSAILHPQEFWCVAHGLLYFLSVPSMYLLLTLYSMINLYVVSWGTREVAAKVPAKAKAQELQQTANAKMKKKSNVIEWINSFGRKPGEDGGLESDDGTVSFEFGNLFRCICCTYPKTNDDDKQMAKIGEQLNLLNEQIIGLHKHMERFANRGLGIRRKSSLRPAVKQNELESVLEISEDEYEDTEDRQNEDNDQVKEAATADDHFYEEGEPLHTYNEVEANPFWITDSSLKDGAIQRLPEREVVFWKELIRSYLYPLEDDPQEKARVANQLKELRNKVVFGLLMLNSLFILIVFLLQMQKDTLHVNWPLNVKANITYISSINEVVIDIDPLKLEPVNLVLAFFFTLILVIQFVAMLFHRFETMSHILASTDFSGCCCCCPDRARKLSGDEDVDKHAVNIAHVLQKLKVEEHTANIYDKVEGNIARRPTIHVLENRIQSKPKFESLDDAFRERYGNLTEDLQPDTPVMERLRHVSRNPEAMEALKRRASFHVSSAANTPALTRSQRRDLMRLDRAFGSPNGSIQSGFSNSGFDDDSIESNSRKSAQSSPASLKKSSASPSLASGSQRVRFEDKPQNSRKSLQTTVEEKL